MASQVDQLVIVRRKLEKQFKESTELFPDFRKPRPIAVLPTKSAIINAVTGLGGIPRGRVTEIYGPEGTGKTTIGLEFTAEIQKRSADGVVLYLDYEHALDPIYARRLGVDLNLDRFVFSQPDYFEQGDAIADAYVSEGLVDAVIIDSAAAMTPKDDLEGNIDSTGRLGLQAQLMARMLSRLTKKLGRGRKPALIILNQTRTKINIRDPRQTGEDAAGGRALRFYTSIRLQLELYKHEGDENRDVKGGGTDQVFTRNIVRVTAVKNKLAPQYQRGLIQIDYGTGTNNIVSIASMAEAKLGIMSGAGFFKYQGDTKTTSFSCRGREEFQALLRDNPVLAAEIEAKVVSTMRSDLATTLGIRALPTAEAVLDAPDPTPITIEGTDSAAEEGSAIPLDDSPV